MIKVGPEPIVPEAVIRQVKTEGSGCVLTYVGLIRGNSHGRPVLAVEYEDADSQAAARLGEIAEEIRRKFPVNKVAICHRTGTLKVGDINFLVAVAAAHREEGFDACRYAVDRFKESLPTRKRETYRDGGVPAGEEDGG